MDRTKQSITVSGRVYTDYDQQTFQRLANYCDRMGLQLEAMQSGSRVDLRITGSESGLNELMDYLEQRKAELSHV